MPPMPMFDLPVTADVRPADAAGPARCCLTCRDLPDLGAVLAKLPAAAPCWRAARSTAVGRAAAAWRSAVSSGRVRTTPDNAPTKNASAPKRPSSASPSVVSASTRTISAARKAWSAAPGRAPRTRSRRVIEAENSNRVDAALYWKAYALDKLNQQADALAAVQESDQALPAEPLDQRRQSARAAGAPERRPGAAPRSRIG